METSSPLGSVPRQQRGIEKRDALYQAALDRFARHGVAGARVEDIVADAGVSWGTFFRYFPRKEDVLLEAAVARQRDVVVPDIHRRLAAEEPARDVAAELLRLVLLPADVNAAVHVAMLREFQLQAARLSQMMGEVEPPVPLLTRVVEYGQRRKEVVDGVPVLLAAVVFAGAAWPVVEGAFGTVRALDDFRAQTPEPAVVLDAAFAVAWRAVEA